MRVPPLLYIQQNMCIYKKSNLKKQNVLIILDEGRGWSLSYPLCASRCARSCPISRCGDTEAMPSGHTTRRQDGCHEFECTRCYSRQDSWQMEVRFTSNQSPKTTPGAPLNSIMCDLDSRCYFSDMAYMDRPDSKVITSFFHRNLDEW